MECIRVEAIVPYPQGWIESALTRLGDYYSGFPLDSLPPALARIQSLSAWEGILVAEVMAASPMEAFWALVDYAKHLSLPAPSL